jgi:16S rRNA (uracil1498-N3)-methyltransferase
MAHCRIHTPQPLAQGLLLTLEPTACRHLTLVLRLRDGAPLTLFNGNGRDYPAHLLCHGKGPCQALVEAEGEIEPPLPLAITLALGIAKGERMDYALQKAVELGVARIVPMITARSAQPPPPERLRNRQAHWQGIVISACEQSGRRRMPALEPPLAFDRVLHQTSEAQLALLLHPEGETTLGELRPPQDPRLLLLTGPEGGLAPAELDAARTAGFQAIRLGPRVLRSETAPLAAIAAIQALWGDFRKD